MAVAEAKAAGAEAVLHCGDIVAPSTIKCLIQYELPAHLIHGNNTGDLYSLMRLTARADNLLQYHGMDACLELAGRRIFLVHYPHYARAMAVTGDWDLVCCGHSHKPNQETLLNLHGRNTILVNPGTVGGIGNAPATYVLADLSTMTFSLQHICTESSHK